MSKEEIFLTIEDLRDLTIPDMGDVHDLIVNIENPNPDPQFRLSFLRYLDREKMKEIHVLGEGELCSSDDGDMLFRKTEDGKRSLIFCLGRKEKEIVPEGTVEIAKYAFEKTAVQSVDLPGSLRSIETEAFAGCRSLREVNFRGGLQKIGGIAFSDTGLRSVRFPGSLREIGTHAFARCRELESAEFSPCEGLSIEYSAFYFCDRLENVKFQEGLKEILGNAFMCCYNLKSVSLPDSLEKLGKKCFGCIQEIRTNKPVEGLIKSIAEESAITKQCFSVDIDGHKFIFPRSMSLPSMARASAMLEHPEKKVTVACNLGKTEWINEVIALEGFRQTGDEKAEEYLKSRGMNLIRHASDDGEDSLIDTLAVLADGNLLSADLLQKALDISTWNGWAAAIAHILEEMRKLPCEEPSFVL